MDMLLRTSIFLWISAGCLSLLDKSEASPNNGLPAICNFVSRNVCLEFVEESRTWSQAKSSCEKKGGKLLKVLNNPIKIFLSSITRESNTSNFTWWTGETIHVDYQEPNQNVSRDFCTYIALNPLQLLTSNCSERRGFLCTHTLRSPSSTEETIGSSDATKSRFKRQSADISFLKLAVTELRGMETTEGQPTDNQRENFIQKLQEGVSKLNQDNVNQDIIQSILGVCTGIQRLSMKKCDVDTNPNPTSLFQDVFKIMQTASMLVSPAGNTPTVFRYPTGNIYLSA
ncbi:uncharacterized protein pkd1l3 [Odontesthes bonariensis]|uniref:uncharacterized protein pkd1l3 n=1 Tax=Odontesthes bonariensis TaxID=219752 RepID=UPI003F583F4D